jgi:hypothetical protein
VSLDPATLRYAADLLDDDARAGREWLADYEHTAMEHTIDMVLWRTRAYERQRKRLRAIATRVENRRKAVRR